MRVPDEFAVDLGDFDVVVVNSGDEAWGPFLGEGGEDSWD